MRSFATLGAVQRRALVLAWGVLLALGVCPLRAAGLGQGIQGSSLPDATVVDAQPGERLSTAILRSLEQAAAARGRTPYLAGAMYSHPGEVTGQAGVRQQLLEALSQSARPEAWAALAAWLKALPLTGRVPLTHTDPRWLQANPGQDPVLLAGDRISLPARPVSVTVLLPDARWCQPSHRAGVSAAHLVAACLGLAGLPKAEVAWVVQPDGQVSRVGLAAWNAQSQAQAAPGAWIWPEVPGQMLPDGAARLLARVLATQGPAADRPLADTAVLRPQLAPVAGWGWREPRDLGVSASDWGEVGLLQTPTARMAPAGSARLHWSRVAPYSRGTVMLQPFDWLEGGFRYTDVSNRLYGPEIAGTQSYKDKSIDFKLRLLEEGPWWPQVALGVRDLGGTGLFSGEYLVASRRWADFDFSLGLGWGYLGARGDLPNPLGGAFAFRPSSDTPSGGTANLKSMFRGRTALFGGVQWQTPWDGLWLKAEIEGNDYRSEPQANVQRQSTPLNLGLVWRALPGLDLMAGVERGQRAMLGFSFHGDLTRTYVPKVLDGAVRPPAAADGAARADWGAMVGWVEARVGWRVDSLNADGARLVLRVSDAFGAYKSDRVERLVEIVHAFAPARFQEFVLHYGQRNLDGLEVQVVDRRRWVAERASAVQPSLARPSLRTVEPSSMPLAPSSIWRPSEARLKFGVAPTYGQILGGPDGFLLFQVGVAADFQLQLDRSSWVTGVLHARLVDNFDKFKYTAPSSLPRVRTFQREYVTSRRVTVPYLQWTHMSRLTEDQFFMAYAGLLEPMFGGAGAEWMWRPAGSPLSLSVDVNRVRQRSFEQDFAFRDYEVTTGHATMRWNTGWQGVVLAASAGQYLAGDRGVTLDISRTFGNGVAMGAFATKTNVSAQAFGEGTFDKGIYMSIPFDVLLAKSTNGYANLVWKPLTRDGGAKLLRSPTLYGVTQIRDSEAFRYQPARD